MTSVKPMSNSQSDPETNSLSNSQPDNIIVQVPSKSWYLEPNLLAALLFVVSLGLLISFWEYGANHGWFAEIMPSASQTFQAFWGWISDPFYFKGEGDQGIGRHVFHSLRRVLIGFLIGGGLGVILGTLLGLSKVSSKAFDPYVQVLRPVSPLAWLPLGLALIKNSETTALFVIAITSIWPTLLNTRFGVMNVDPTYLDVARSLGASPWRILTKIIFPAAAPSILAGLRISIGIAWLVIVAAEMLTGGPGIGYFIWNEWNNLDITAIITAILVVGLVGLIIDRLFIFLQELVAFGRKV
jgi:nitrate/nitrite transport system permease protein